MMISGADGRTAGNHRLTSQGGYTLLEITIALLIASLLVGACIPAFLNLKAERQLRKPVTALDTLLQHARQDAIATGLPVKLTLSPDGFSYGDDRVPVEKGVRLRARLTGETDWRPPQGVTVSIFPTGLCEPWHFEFALEDGSYLQVGIEPLTGFIEEDQSFIR